MSRSRTWFVLLVPLLAGAAWLVSRHATSRGADEQSGIPAEAEVARSDVALRAPTSTPSSSSVPAAAEATRRTESIAAQVEGEAKLILLVLAQETDSPLAGIEVTVHEQACEADAVLSLERVSWETTDERGRLPYPAGAGKEFCLEVEALDPTVAGSARVEVPALAAGERREIVVRLPEARELLWFGQVFDDTGATPLEGARAFLVEQEAFADPTGLTFRVEHEPFDEPIAQMAATSTADGILSLPVRGSSSCARIELGGYAPGLVRLAPGHEQRTTACPVRLMRAATLEAFVTDPSGAPREGLEVRVTVWQTVQRGDGQAFQRPVGAFTDERGHCVLEGLTPAEPLSVELLDDTLLLRQEAGSVRLGPGEHRILRWTVGERCTLVGRTVEADGRPAAGVTVFLAPDFGQLRFRPYLGDDERATRSESDAEGRFTFEIATGAWLVGPALGSIDPRVGKRWLGEVAPLAERVVIAPEQRRAEVTLVCWRGLFLSGTVRELDGGLVSSGMVTVTGEDVVFSTSFRGGSFSVGPLPPGSYQLSAGRSGPDGRYASEPRTVEAGTENIELVLRPSTGLAVRVVDERGEPVHEAAVWILSGRKYGNRAYSNAEGVARFEDLPDEVFSLSVATADGEFALERGVTLAAGSTREVELRLAPAPRVRIEVLNGPEVDMQTVIFLDGEPIALMFLDQGSTTALAPGEYEIALWGDSDDELQRRRARVEAGDETRVVFDLSAPR